MYGCWTRGRATSIGITLFDPIPHEREVERGFQVAIEVVFRDQVFERDEDGGRCECQADERDAIEQPLAQHRRVQPAARESQSCQLYFERPSFGDHDL